MSSTYAPERIRIERRVAGENVWLRRAGDDDQVEPAALSPHRLNYEVLDSESNVGRAMLEEIKTAARETEGDLTIVLLGGRGAQALHRLLGELAKTNELDRLLSRLNVFTQ